MSTTKRSGDNNDMARSEKGLFEGLIEALANKHSQLEINFQNVNLRMPGMQLGVELNGAVSLSVHMRDMSEDEKRAFAAKNVGMMTTAK